MIAKHNISLDFRTKFTNGKKRLTLYNTKFVINNNSISYINNINSKTNYHRLKLIVTNKFNKRLNN